MMKTNEMTARDTRCRSGPASETTAWLASLAHSAAELLLPPTCVSCGAPGAMICTDCGARLLFVATPRCPRCGRPLGTSRPTDHACITAESDLDQVFAPYAYQPPLDQIIHAFKYTGYFALARPLGELLASAWPRWFDPPQLIVPVPLHPRRLRERGFNQSALLARQLAQRRHLPLDEQALGRVRHTVPQVGLNPQQRHANVMGAFTAVPTSVQGQHVLLVDDVWTTGATMRAAAAALAAAGAARVSAFCLARAVS